MRFSDPKTQIEIELTVYGCDWQTDDDITEMRQTLERLILDGLQPIVERQIARQKKNTRHNKAP